MSTQQNQKARQEQERRQQAAQQSGAVEFESVEEVLRADRAGQPAPPELEARLAQSIKAEPAPEKSFWQKLFGGG